MIETNREKTSSRAFDIDPLAKSIAFFTILLFCIGFLTSDLYLQKLGFSDFSLLQARFILTGCLVLFSISFSGLCIMFGCSSIFYFIDNYKQDAPKTHTLPKWFIRKIATHPSRSRLVLSSIALVLPAIISLCQAEGRDFSERFTISLWLYTFSMIPGVVYFVLWRDFITNKRRINSTQDYVFLSLAYLFCFFLYIVPFAQYIYPRIPEQVGGGKPRIVQIIFAKDQAEIIRQFNIPTCTTGEIQSNLSKPLSLLFEGSEHYFLRLEDRAQPVKIGKKAIIGEIPLIDNLNKNQKATDCPRIPTTNSNEKLKNH